MNEAKCYDIHKTIVFYFLLSRQRCEPSEQLSSDHQQCHPILHLRSVPRILRAFPFTPTTCPPTHLLLTFHQCPPTYSSPSIPHLAFHLSPSTHTHSQENPLPTLKPPPLPPPSPSLCLQLPLQPLPLRVRPLLRSFRADFRPRVGGNLLLRSRPWLWSRWGRRWLVRRSPGGRADGCAFAADRAELFAFGVGLLGRGRGGRGCWRGLRLGRGFAAADRAEFGFGVWFAGFRFGRRGG